MTPVLAEVFDVGFADLVVFVVAGAVVLAGGFGVVLARNPVHAALSLITTLFGVAVLFVSQQADFLAVVQVIVYAGAIVVLFLFVIMLLGVDKEESIAAEPLKAQRPVALALGLLVLVELVFLSGIHFGSIADVESQPGITPTDPGAENVEQLARTIFTRYLYAFEVTSVLLVIAVVGAVVLARRAGVTRQRPASPSTEPVSR